MATATRIGNISNGVRSNLTTTALTIPNSATQLVFPAGVSLPPGQTWQIDFAGTYSVTDSDLDFAFVVEETDGGGGAIYGYGDATLFYDTGSVKTVSMVNRFVSTDSTDGGADISAYTNTPLPFKISTTWTGGNYECFITLKVVFSPAGDGSKSVTIQQGAHIIATPVRFSA